MRLPQLAPIQNYDARLTLSHWVDERNVVYLELKAPGSRNQLSVRIELQADCLAGVWGNSTEQRAPPSPRKRDIAVWGVPALSITVSHRSTMGSIR